MRLKGLLSLFALLTFCSSAYSMDKDFFSRMMERLQNDEIDSVSIFLKEKEMQLARDPDYYVLLLNHAILLARKYSLVIAKGAPKGNDLALKDTKTGETVGFIGERKELGESFLVDAITKTQNALDNFKERLDIRFGVIIASQEINRWDLLANQLLDILNVSTLIDNKWEWGTENSMTGNPRDFMLENVQTNISKLFRVESPIADSGLVKVSNRMIELYPELIYGYANLGVLYLAQNEYKKAEFYLKKANRINPKDDIVNENLNILRKSKK